MAHEEDLFSVRNSGLLKSVHPLRWCRSAPTGLVHGLDSQEKNFRQVRRLVLAGPPVRRSVPLAAARHGVC